MNAKSVGVTFLTGLVALGLLGLSGAPTYAVSADSNQTEFTQVDNQAAEGSDDTASRSVDQENPKESTEDNSTPATASEQTPETGAEEGAAPSSEISEITADPKTDETAEEVGTVEPSVPTPPKANVGTSKWNGAPGRNSSSATAIDTSSRAAVQQAYEAGYLSNNVYMPMANGVNVADCNAGFANPIGSQAVVDSLNFMRSLNGLNPVSINGNSALSQVVQETALIQAANKKLSHFPERDGMKQCLTSNGAAGAAVSNISQSAAQSPAEQIQWFVQDWSPKSNPFNDALGHRLTLFNPHLVSTAVGSVDGYTAIAVNQSNRYQGLNIDSAMMMNKYASTPEVISWPNRGYFPQQLLTAMNSNDEERWSFSIKNADVSKATATLTGPAGRIPVTVLASGGSTGKYQPRKVQNYSTVLLKFPHSAITKASGQGSVTYTVKISGVRGTDQSTYSYQVKLFDGNVASSVRAPKLYLQHTVVALQGDVEGSANDVLTRTPVLTTGYPAPTVTWQRSEDGGRTWKNFTSPSKASAVVLTGRLPSGEGITPKTRFRAVASNSAGSDTTEVITPEIFKITTAGGERNIRAGRAYQLGFETAFQGNGGWLKVTDAYWNGRFTEGSTTWLYQRLPEDTADYRNGHTANMTIKKPQAGKTYRLRPAARVMVGSYEGFHSYVVTGDWFEISAK